MILKLPTKIGLIIATAVLSSTLAKAAEDEAYVNLSRVNYLVRFDDNYDGRLSAKYYFAFL